MTESPRTPITIVAAVAVALVAVDAFVAAGIAQDDQTPARNGETPPPQVIPAEAFLTGPVQREAEVAGLHVELVEHAAQPYVLRIRNRTGVEQRAKFEVDCWVTSGAMESRMGPIARRVRTETVELVVAAETTVERRLAWLTRARPEPRASDDGANARGIAWNVPIITEIETTEIVLRRHGSASTEFRLGGALTTGEDVLAVLRATNSRVEPPVAPAAAPPTATAAANIPRG